MTSSVLLSSMGLQCKQSFVRPMFRFCLLANPILNTVLLYEMYRGAGEENFFAYVALGAGLMAVWSAICFSSAGDINRERYSGTLALLFAAPAGFPAIVLGKILGNTFLSLASIGISVATAALLFGLDALRLLLARLLKRTLHFGADFLKGGPQGTIGHTGLRKRDRTSQSVRSSG